jgi:Holliday junction resolvase-like predicted endonuclease
MASRSKRKGSYHENKVRDYLEASGFSTKKQPLSGSLGGEYRGDLVTEIKGRRLVVEVKYRDTSGFPSPFTVLDQRDMAIYRRKQGEPKMIAIMDLDVLIDLLCR